VLQVVKNPAAITPYVSCTLVGLGLIVQFLMHLVDFGKRGKGKKQAPSIRAAVKADSQIPAGVSERGAS
jgi:hypothetical protein